MGASFGRGDGVVPIFKNYLKLNCLTLPERPSNEIFSE